MKKTNERKLSFCTILTLIFIALKLCGAITWNWVWVLAPFWIGLIILAIIVVLAVALKIKL